MGNLFSCCIMEIIFTKICCHNLVDKDINYLTINYIISN